MSLFMSEVTFTDSNFESEVLKHDGLVLVDFFAEWCGPCKMMAPTIEKLSEEYKGKVKIGKMDVDNNQNVSMKYEIQSIPTLIFFKNGEMVDKMIGFQSAEALKQKLDAL
jgi:thioredoxin 1